MNLRIEPVRMGKTYEDSVPNAQVNRVAFKAGKDIVTITKGAKKTLSNKTIRNTFLGAITLAVLEFFGLEQLLNKPSEAEIAVRENVFQKSLADVLSKNEKTQDGRKKLENEGKSKEAAAKSIISDAVDELIAENTKYKNIEADKISQIKEKMYEMANIKGDNFKMDEDAIDCAIALVKQDFKSRSF